MAKKRTTIYYEITDSPYRIKLCEQDLNELPPEINKETFKKETIKYLSKMDNLFNLRGKKIKSGDLDFIIKEKEPINWSDLK